MRTKLAERLIVFTLIFLIAIPTTLLARDDDSSKKSASTAEETAKLQPKGKLSEEENPLLIGKRNINKHQIDFYSLQKEVALGQQLAAQVDQQGKFIEDPVVTEYVNRVGQNLVLHSDAKVPFTIKVLDSDDVNAFALPGGFFYVNKGLILAADNEAEVACVMAHEIGHVAARHGVEQASKAQIANLAIIPLIFMTGGLAYLVYNAISIALPVAFLKFSRGMEAEADMLGAEYAWASGYDPSYMLTFFEKIERKDKAKPGTLSKLFDTHPPTPDRIVKVKNLISRFPDRDEYIINTSDFAKVKGRLLAASNARVLGSPGDKNEGPRRPTLKRRSDNAGDTTDPESTPGAEPQSPGDKPTLKRHDDSTTTTTTPDSTAKPPSSSGPPN